LRGVTPLCCPPTTWHEGLESRVPVRSAPVGTISSAPTGPFGLGPGLAANAAAQRSPSAWKRDPVGGAVGLALAGARARGVRPRVVHAWALHASAAERPLAVPERERATWGDHEEQFLPARSSVAGKPSGCCSGAPGGGPGVPGPGLVHHPAGAGQRASRAEYASRVRPAGYRRQPPLPPPGGRTAASPCDAARPGRAWGRAVRVLIAVGAGRGRADGAAAGVCGRRAR
jgi:hypothetical protein